MGFESKFGLLIGNFQGLSENAIFVKESKNSKKLELSHRQSKFLELSHSNVRNILITKPEKVTFSVTGENFVANQVFVVPKTLYWNGAAANSSEPCLMIQITVSDSYATLIELCCVGSYVYDILQESKCKMEQRPVQDEHRFVFRSGVRRLMRGDSLAEAELLSGNPLMADLVVLGGMQGEHEQDLSGIENLETSILNILDRFEQRNSPQMEQMEQRTTTTNPQETTAQDLQKLTSLPEIGGQYVSLEKTAEIAGQQYAKDSQRECLVGGDQQIQTSQLEWELEKKKLEKDIQMLQFSFEASENQKQNLMQEVLKLKTSLKSFQQMSEQHLAQLSLENQPAVEDSTEKRVLVVEDSTDEKRRVITKLRDSLKTDERHDMTVLKHELSLLDEMLASRWQKGKVIQVTEKGVVTERVQTYIDREIDDDEVFMECWLEISREIFDKKIDMSQGLPFRKLIESRNLESISKTLLQAWELNLAEFTEKFVSFPLDKFGQFKKSNVAESVKEIFEYISPASVTRAKAVSRKDIERFMADETLQDIEGFNYTDSSTSKDLLQAMNDIAKSLLPTPQNEYISFLEFKTAMRRVPRVCGHRIQWVQSLELDKALARHLLPGKVENGLDGIMKMTSSKFELTPELDAALNAFCEDARAIVVARAKELHNSKTSSSAQEANSKFHGFTGNFADLPDFYDGAEEAMHLAYPNPNTIKGIRDEHTGHPSANKVFVTTNYFIATSLRVEYFWATNPVLRDTDTSKFLKEYAEEYADGNVKRKDEDYLYPGETGDQFKESLVFISAVVSESFHVIKDELKSNRSLLEAEMMKSLFNSHLQISNMIRVARGIRVMDHDSCLERLKKESSMIGSEPDSQIVIENKIMIGIILPMAPAKVNSKLLDKVQNSVNSKIGKPELTWKCEDVVRSTTSLYCLHPSILSLRKRLAELSEDELREQAENKWSVYNTSLGVDRKGLHDLVIKSYVKTELQSDFEAALISAFHTNKEEMKRQTKKLMEKWEVPIPSDNLKQDLLIDIAVGALISEIRWRDVEKWVQLYRVRIQGRQRMDVLQIEEKKKEQISQFNLVKSEVLAAYLYTGPCYLPYNGVYRKYPPSIVDLLKGNATGTPNNTLSTTLYCISSSLIKISRKTELPIGGKVYRGFGSMTLPSKFWVPTGNPAWRGGVERAIMSTTTEKEVAVFYSSGKGTVAEISVGRIQMGGEMSWISMVNIHVFSDLFLTLSIISYSV